MVTFEDVTVDEHAPKLPQRYGLLEVLHPAGSAPCIVGMEHFSGTLPEHMSRSQQEHTTGLIVFAPSPAECHNNDWVEAMLRQLTAQLAPDGIAYVLVPRRWRLKLLWLLRKYNLACEVAMVHIPYGAAGDLLVPLHRIPVQYAFSRLISASAWRRWLVLLAVRLPNGDKLLAYVPPTVGLVVRRPGARPLFDWLFRLAYQLNHAGDVIVQPSWRGPDGSIILYCFAGVAEQPIAVAKLSPKLKAAERVAEASTLAYLRHHAERAGAHLPKPLGIERLGNHVVLVQSAVRGVSAAKLLAAKSRRLLPIMERIVDWLTRWNIATRVVRTLEHHHVQRSILAPVSLLAPLLQHGTAYEAWLRERCAAVVGRAMPFVAAHNDLTMQNVLLDARDQLGIVDWEHGATTAFPLADFFYAMTDAVAAAWGRADRRTAFTACYAHGGAYAIAATNFQTRLSRAVHVPSAFVDLCFHACWLHHAVNEVQASKHGAPQPFLSIVQWLAADSPYTSENMQRGGAA